jgi:hypothetical protein
MNDRSWQSIVLRTDIFARSQPLFADGSSQKECGRAAGSALHFPIRLPEAGSFHVQGSVQMKRRTVLAGAAASAAGFVSGADFAADTPAANHASPDLATALARFRASIPAHFDRTYVENAVVPLLPYQHLRG